MTRHDRRRRPLLRAAVCGVVAFATIGIGMGIGSVAAARPYVPSGTSVVGGDDPGGATALVPGVYTDTLARGAAGSFDTGSVRYFAITVRTGQTPYVGVTVAPPTDVPTEGQLGVQVTLTAQGGTSACETQSASDFATDDRLDPVTAVAAPGAIGEENRCPAGNLIVRVVRTGAVALSDPLRFELAYRLEPAAAETLGLPPPAPTAQPSLRPGLTGTPATLASGNSFDTAPLVGSGIYTDTLTAGDIRIVRVHLDWGQRFAYSFSSAAQSKVTSDDSVGATAEIRNPLRQVARQANGSSPTAFSVGASDATMSGATAAPVRYLNRESEDTDVPAYANAGDYYLVIATNVPRAGDPTLTYPYSLQIRVAGTAQPGPVYAGAATATPPAETGNSGSSSTGVVVAAIAAAGVVLLVVLLLVVVRSRRRGDEAATRQVGVHT